MKKRLQGLIAGVLIGITLAGITTFATNTIALYDVIASGIKIIVDGQTLNPTDVNGNKVEPIIYNGTTYLPVRAVANALGKAVYWDGPNYTVYLGDTDGKLEYPTTELEQMVSIVGKVHPTNNLYDNYGNAYSRACYADNMEFLTNMKYSRFKATLYIGNGESTPASKWVKVVADGKTIYTSPELTKSSTPIDLDVDIRGYNDIAIQIERKQGFLDGNLSIYFGNAGFYQ